MGDGEVTLNGSGSENGGGMTGAAPAVTADVAEAFAAMAGADNQIDQTEAAADPALAANFAAVTGDGNVSQEEYENFKSSDFALAAGQDGLIDGAEGQQMGDNALLANFVAVAGEDGMIDFKEYRKLKDSKFTCLDTNGNGLLEEDEAKADPALAASFDEIAGEDGRIDYGEYRAFMDSGFEKVSGGDGVIDEQDAEDDPALGGNFDAVSGGDGEIDAGEYTDYVEAHKMGVAFEDFVENPDVDELLLAVGDPTIVAALLTSQAYKEHVKNLEDAGVPTKQVTVGSGEEAEVVTVPVSKNLKEGKTAKDAAASQRVLGSVAMIPLILELIRSRKTGGA